MFPKHMRILVRTQEALHNQGLSEDLRSHSAGQKMLTWIQVRLGQELLLRLFRRTRQDATKAIPLLSSGHVIMCYLAILLLYSIVVY